MQDPNQNPSISWLDCDGYNAVENEQMRIGDFLEQDIHYHIALIADNQAYLIDKNQINIFHQLDKFYPCHAVDVTLIPRQNNVQTDIELINLRSLGLVSSFVTLEDLSQMWYDKHQCQLFVLQTGGTAYPAFTSADVLTPNQSVVGRLHCQDGYGGHVRKIIPMSEDTASPKSVLTMQDLLARYESTCKPYQEVFRLPAKQNECLVGFENSAGCCTTAFNKKIVKMIACLYEQASTTGFTHSLRACDREYVEIARGMHSLHNKYENSIDVGRSDPIENIPQTLDILLEFASRLFKGQTQTDSIIVYIHRAPSDILQSATLQALWKYTGFVRLVDSLQVNVSNMHTYFHQPHCTLDFTRTSISGFTAETFVLTLQAILENDEGSVFGLYWPEFSDVTAVKSHFRNLKRQNAFPKFSEPTQMTIGCSHNEGRYELELGFMDARDYEEEGSIYDKVANMCRREMPERESKRVRR